ncbi:hypothetical protein GGX14DRAFT_470742, partial [Mycena pura]
HHTMRLHPFRTSAAVTVVAIGILAIGGDVHVSAAPLPRHHGQQSTLGVGAPPRSSASVLSVTVFGVSLSAHGISSVRKLNDAAMRTSSSTTPAPPSSSSSARQ